MRGSSETQPFLHGEKASGDVEALIHELRCGDAVTR
jgi:hypothetical protein